MTRSAMRSYQKLSASERRLMGLTLVILIGAVFVVGLIRAMDSISALDETIAGFQQDLVRYTKETAQADTVNKAFEAIASQHSSQWTQEEIHDRLRREITRLSLRNVPAPGVEVAAAAAGNLLVDIRSMPSGTLEDSGEGYRSYTITFRTEPTQALNIAVFLERLQCSDQALRIDTLDMTRQPASDLVTASIKVTRTVIGEDTGPGGGLPPASAPANLARNAGFEEWDAQANRFPEWTTQGCTVSPFKTATEGASSLRAEAAQPDASVYQELQLPGGKSYGLTADNRKSVV